MRFVLLWASLVASAADDFASIKLPDSPADLARGKKLYFGSCTYCHGPTGDGGKGADLSRRDLVRAKADGDLVRVIEIGVPGTEMPSAWHMTRREVTQVAAFVRSLARVENTGIVPGNPTTGKALYSKNRCANCHTIEDGHAYSGGYMGPDLSSIGLKRNAAHLRASLTDPAATLPEDFVPIKVITKSGKTIEGRRIHEDTFALVIRDFAGNNHSLFKSDLQSATMDTTRSPMPSYKDKLSPAELDDLIAYLVSLKEPL